MIHAYYGTGKGKTTAAMGLVLRALGAGWSVVVVQFLKGGSSGEISLLETLPSVKVLRGKNSKKFSFQMTQQERILAREAHEENLAEARRLVAANEVDMLVLDEALGALEKGLLSESSIRALLDEKPQNMELIFTGRVLPDYIAEKADYLTEMVEKRHPYQRGVTSRKGVEF